MADYYIKELSKNKKTAIVVFHLPVGDGKNNVGITWQKVLATHKKMNIPTESTQVVSAISDISEADLVKIRNGQLFEVVKTVRFSSTNLSNEQRLAEIRDNFIATKDNELRQMETQLSFYGYAGLIE